MEFTITNNDLTKIDYDFNSRKVVPKPPTPEQQAAIAEIILNGEQMQQNQANGNTVGAMNNITNIIQQTISFSKLSKYS